MTLEKSTIPITILMCDDDEDDRLLTRQALEDAHISNTLRFVEDGEECLDYLHQRGDFAGEAGLAPRPGLILLDLHIPGLGGREVLAAIKRARTLFDIPIVVLSTTRHDEDIVRGYQLGVNSLLRSRSRSLGSSRR